MIIRLAALVLLFAASGFGQSFEAASVRPSPPTSSGSPNDPVSFFARRSTLKLLIAQAYDVLIDQVSGGPAWTADDIFDIQARAASPSTQNEKMAMLGALLADRFQLKFHREPGTLRAYALVVAKGGPKFHAAKADDPPPVRTPGTISTRTLKSLASIVTVYLKIPFPATGAPPLSEPEPLPVVDQTGLRRLRHNHRFEP